MKKKILITDKAHEMLPDGLREKGFLVDYNPGLSYEMVKERLNAYQGIIINSKVICDKAFLQSASHLEFIGRLGSGLDIIDLEEARNLGIEIINSPEGNANAVAEHVMALLLASLNHIIPASNDVKKFNWNREANRGSELSGKTIGIIGFGHTGTSLAMKLRSFNVRILCYDKYRDEIGKDFPFVHEMNLSGLQAQSDIISIHLPLTSETRGIINTDFFAKCKQGVIIINSSRGEILQSDHLLADLNSGKIKAACLDVLENEKIEKWTIKQQEVYSELLKKDNVIITPHIAGWTHESLFKIADVLLQKIIKFYNI